MLPHGEANSFQPDTGIVGNHGVAAWMIAERGVNTLVLVHRRQLLDQWIDRLSQFLAISPKEIGRLGGGRRKLTGRIDVDTLRSLVRKASSRTASPTAVT